jgi:hypothetical protein
MVIDKVLSIMHTEQDRPMCCGQHMKTHISVPPMIHWVDPIIEPFKHVAVQSDEVITSKRQNKEFMKRHDLVYAN